MLGGWIWRSPERFLSEREGVKIVHHRHKHVHRKLPRQRFIEESGWKIYGAGITQLQSLGPNMLHTHCRRRCDMGLPSSRVDFQHRLSYGLYSHRVRSRPSMRLSTLEILHWQPYHCSNCGSLRSNFISLVVYLCIIFCSALERVVFKTCACLILSD